MFIMVVMMFTMMVMVMVMVTLTKSPDRCRCIVCRGEGNTEGDEKQIYQLMAKSFFYLFRKEQNWGKKVGFFVSKLRRCQYFENL